MIWPRHLGAVGPKPPRLWREFVGNLVRLRPSTFTRREEPVRGILATAVGLVMALALLLGAPPSNANAAINDGVIDAILVVSSPALDIGPAALQHSVFDVSTTSPGVHRNVQVPMKDGTSTDIVRTDVASVHTLPEVARSGPQVVFQNSNKSPGFTGGQNFEVEGLTLQNQNVTQGGIELAA